MLVLLLVRPWSSGADPAAEQPDQPDALTAAIVDQLSVDEPQPPFARAATTLLERAGYAVDYYPGEEVTVEFFRRLPTNGYDLILLRAHSGLIQGGSREGEAFIFTTEPYSSTKYADEQSEQRLLLATYGVDESVLGAQLRDLPQFFGIVPAFIRHSMEGDFGGATIVVMGCNGLTADTMAEAFVERGARSVVSWDGLVTGDHTDEATERLLQLLLSQGLPLGEAVRRTDAEVGPDPHYQSELLFYPLEESSSTIP